MQVIDIHTHIYPDDIAQKATDSVREFYQIGQDGDMDGTVGMLLRRGRQAGITKFVVSRAISASTPGSRSRWHAEQQNRDVRAWESASRHSQGKRDRSATAEFPGIDVPLPSIPVPQ